MGDSSLIMQTIVFALAAGVFCLLISEKLKVPSIFFFLAAGIVLGPEFADVIRPQDIGQGFVSLIELGVAIILFEGGLQLNIGQLRRSSKPIQRLLTLGAVITFVGATMSAALIMGMPWKYSFIFGALMIVTGPTVIGPILKRTPLRQRVSTILHSESVLLDSVGAVAAVLILEFVLAEESSLLLTSIKFFRILLIGTVVGAACGYVLRLFLKWSQSLSRESINLAILAGALLSFELAHILVNHSGLVSVVVAGMVLAYGPVKEREEVQEFKATLTSLIVGLLFVLLAAKLDINAVIGIAQTKEGLIFLGSMLLVVRPLSVFASLRKTDLKFNEKCFLAFMAPRGIVAASTASLFAVIFAAEGHNNANQLELFVYLIIVTTVLLQGLPAGLIARLLRVLQAKRTGVIIVGAHSLGQHIGKWLREKGIEVILVDTNFWNVRSAIKEGFDAYHGNALDRGFLENVHINRVGTLLALTPNDEVNILVSQLGNQLLHDGHAFQMMPHYSDQTHDISKDLGGKGILPGLPYLDELNAGLASERFTWTSLELPQKITYEGPIMTEHGNFWPLYWETDKDPQLIHYGDMLRINERAVGILQPKQNAPLS